MQTLLLRPLSRLSLPVLPRPTLSLPLSAVRHSSSSSSSSSSSYKPRPGPPSLPPSDQKDFENLQRLSNAPLSRSAQSETEAEEKLETSPKDGEEWHPEYRRKPLPKWEGRRNPETGEVDGPKFEPLEHGDWSYGGKVTDF